MGSSLGGIYTVITAIVTLAVLFFQIISMRQANEMAYTTQNNSDYNELFNKLYDLLSAPPTLAIKDLVKRVPEDELLEPAILRNIETYNRHYPQILPLLGALNQF